MKRLPRGHYTKEFREEAVRVVTEEEMSSKKEVQSDD